jgi:hypothetical protein
LPNHAIPVYLLAAHKSKRGEYEEGNIVDRHLADCKGLAQAISLGFQGMNIVLGVLAVAAGVLTLMNK